MSIASWARIQSREGFIVAPVHVIADTESAAAVLHPLRQQILRELAEPDSASGLARRLGMPRQQLNYHLRLLEEQGLVMAVEERQRRGCVERLLRTVAASYVISPGTLGELATDPAQVQDRGSSAYLVAVAARTLREVAEQRSRAEARGRQFPTLTLQSDVRFSSPAAQHAFAQELAAALAGLIEKYHDEGSADGRWFRVMAGAYVAPAGAVKETTRTRKGSRDNGTEE